MLRPLCWEPLQCSSKGLVCTRKRHGTRQRYLNGLKERQTNSSGQPISGSTAFFTPPANVSWMELAFAVPAGGCVLVTSLGRQTARSACDLPFYITGLPFFPESLFARPRCPRATSSSPHTRLGSFLSFPAIFHRLTNAVRWSWPACALHKQACLFTLMYPEKHRGLLSFTHLQSRVALVGFGQTQKTNK